MWCITKVASDWLAGMVWARCNEAGVAGHKMNWVVMLRARLVAMWSGQVQ